MRKEVFQFPGWRDRDGCCHLCQCKPSDMRDFESCRPFQPLDHYSLMATIAQTHGGVNELFKTPGLTSKQFLLDWLHIVDLGITCDFLGNLFQYLVQSNLLDGNTYNEKWSLCLVWSRTTIDEILWRTSSNFDIAHDQEKKHPEPKA